MTDACNPLDSVSNGQYSYSRGKVSGRYPYGTAAILTCDTGFHRSGNWYRNCQRASFIPHPEGQCRPSKFNKTSSFI